VQPILDGKPRYASQLETRARYTKARRGDEHIAPLPQTDFELNWGFRASEINPFNTTRERARKEGGLVLLSTKTAPTNLEEPLPPRGIA